MKIRFLVIPVFAALLAAGCGKKETASASASSTDAASGAATASSTGTPAATSATPATPAAPAPADTKQNTTAAASKGAARVIEITGNDAMKFSLTTIEAKAGEQITVKLVNVGSLPKEAMGHNWVLLKTGSDVMAFSTAAMTARDKEYIPDSLKNQVVAHTKLLGPKQTDEVTFTVPAAGEYPFLCSFPAHAPAGMRGVLVAK